MKSEDSYFTKENQNDSEMNISEQFYQKYGTPEHWSCLKGMDLEDIVETKPTSSHGLKHQRFLTPENNTMYSSHDKVIEDLIKRLRKTDTILNKDREYLHNYDYHLSGVHRNYNGHHEADLICVMDNRAYAFEVKTGYNHRPKAIHQLLSDEYYIKQNYPNVEKIELFYVQGRPSNYIVEHI